MNRYVAALAALLVCLAALSFTSIYDSKLELSSYNFRQQTFPAKLSDRILIGGLDEKSAEYFGPLPWSREVFALLVSDLAERGASGVFLDLIFDLEKSEDVQLGQALGAMFSIVAGAIEDGKHALQVPTVSPEIARRTAVGVINKDEDKDEVVRFAWLAMTVNHDSWPERPLLSPALLAFLYEKGVSPESLSYTANGLPLASVRPNTREFPHHHCPGRIEGEGFSIPVSVSVNQNLGLIVFSLPIRYGLPQTYLDSGPNVVSFVDIPDTELAGKYLFIGENTRTAIDVVKTPTGFMKGVEAHAAAFSALLEGSYLQQITNAELLYPGLALVLLLLLDKVHRGRAMIARCIGLAGVVLVLNLALFYFGYWIPLALPVLQIFLTGALLMLFRTEIAKQTFASLTTKEAAQEMLVSDTGDALEATTVNATIIVSDIRGYTTLSETRTPAQMVELLNQYHTETVAIYERFGGRALTYQGDAQLIVFGYPNKIKNPAKASVQAAAGLQEAVLNLRKLWNVSDDTFSVGAACCTGSVAIGRLGAKGEQIQYTVIGDPVRRAHKIQSLSGELDSPVLMDPETAAQIGTQLNLESLGVIEVPGLSQPLELFRPTSA
ncbi:MAG: adenylate/guanylate cyclase domain-containing protein [Vulcanimicrobiota bacterium]